MSSVRQKIEDAVICAIAQSLHRKNNPESGYLEHVGPYNGELDEQDGPQHFIETLRGRMPAVLVTAAESSSSSEDIRMRAFRRTLTFQILVISDHMRDKESRLRADVSHENDPNCDPGIYKMLDDISEVVAGNCFGLDGIGPLRPGAESALLHEKGFTVWIAQYTTDTDQKAKPYDFGDVPLKDIFVDGNLSVDVSEDSTTAPGNPLVEADITGLNP